MRLGDGTYYLEFGNEADYVAKIPDSKNGWGQGLREGISSDRPLLAKSDLSIVWFSDRAMRLHPRDKQWIESYQKSCDKSPPIDKRWNQSEILWFARRKMEGGEAKRKKTAEDLVKLFELVNDTHLGVTQDRCIKFIEQIREKIGRTSIKLEVVTWQTNIGLVDFLEHSALKVTLPDDSVFYIDDALLGGLGNDEHIFGQSDIPKRYKPPGYYNDHLEQGIIAEAGIAGVFGPFIIPSISEWIRGE
jgi:hypothetical protein